MLNLPEEIKNLKQNSQYIPLAEAGEILGTSRDYMNVLVRRGKLRAVKLGRNWFTTGEWLSEYQSSVGKNNAGVNFLKFEREEKIELENLKAKLVVDSAFAKASADKKELSERLGRIESQFENIQTFKDREISKKISTAIASQEIKLPSRKLENEEKSKILEAVEERIKLTDVSEFQNVSKQLGVLKSLKSWSHFKFSLASGLVALTMIVSLGFASGLIPLPNLDISTFGNFENIKYQASIFSNVLKNFPNDLSSFSQWLADGVNKSISLLKSKSPSELTIENLESGKSKIAKPDSTIGGTSINTFADAEALDSFAGEDISEIAENRTSGGAVSISGGNFSLLENRLSVVEADLKDQTDLINSELSIQKKTILGVIESMFGIAKLVPEHPISTFVVQGQPATLTTYSIAPQVQTGFDRLSATSLSLSSSATINGSLTVKSGATLNSLSVTTDAAILGNATIGGTLAVTGDTTLSNLTATGNSVFTNASTTYLTVANDLWGNRSEFSTSAKTPLLWNSGSLTASTTGSNPIIFATNSSERARFTDTGFFGIGTTTPGNLLSVNSTGNVYFGGDLTVSGNSNFANLSTFVNASTTNGTITNLWATNGTITNASSTYATLTNLWSTTGNITNGTITNASTTYLTISDNLWGNHGLFSGGLGIGVATTTNGVLQTLGDASIGGNLYVSGNSTTIGASSANTLTVNSSITSDLIPDQNAVRDLGSTSFYWDNGYINTLTVNNISAASTTIGGTQSASFTINSDNASADYESESIIFFRGTVVPNAVITWNNATSSKRFEFNQAMYINDGSASTTNPTFTIQSVASQTANAFQIIDNNSSAYFTVNPVGSNTTMINASSTNLTATNFWSTNGNIGNFTITNASTTYATLPTFWSSNANITGGTITGITDLTVADGGTGASTLTGFVYGNGASAMTATTTPFFNLGFYASGNSTITNASTTYSSISDTAWINALNLTNALTVANGGTGASTLTDHGVLVGSGADPITALSVGTNGQLLIGSTTADPVFATLNCANALTCTIGAGTLQVDFDGGDSPGGELGGTWASPTIDDLFIKNTGDVGTGSYTFPNASSTYSTVSDTAWINNLVATNATTTTFRSSGLATFGGNVGIGTTTPGSLLDVWGNVHAYGSLSASSTAYLPTLITTNGTITNASSTYLTATNLWATNSNLTTLTATGGTITNASTTYATIPTFWSTLGTITTLNSTNGTITNASTTYATLPTFWSSNANITGGTITGITDLTVADGGTGASTLTGFVYGNGASAMTATTTPFFNLGFYANGNSTITNASTTYLTVGSNIFLPNSVITNANLANSSLTVNGTAIALGASGTVTAAAGTLTGTALNATVVSSSLTSLGTITTGVWNGTDIAVADGGTGVSTLTGLLQGNGTSVITGVTGTTGQIPYYNGTNTLLATSTIFLSTAGNVGIGTTGPGAKLNVNGHALIGGVTAPYSNAYTLNVVASDQAAVYTADLAVSSLTGRAFAIGATGESYVRTLFYSNSFVGFGSGSADRDVFIGRSAANTLRIGSTYDGTGTGNLIVNGNVGIGTTAPGEKLDINGALFVGNSPASSNGNMLIEADGSWGGIVANTDSAGKSTVVSKAMRLQLGGNGLLVESDDTETAIGSARTWSEKMRVTTDGNVGIGTTGPTGKLEIVDSRNTDDHPVRLINNYNNNFIQSYSAMAPNLGTGYHVSGYTVGTAFSARNAAYLAFYNAGAGSTSNYLSLGLHSVDDALVVQATGNVGIGTTVPGAVLDVNGNVMHTTFNTTAFDASVSNPYHTVAATGGYTGIRFQSYYGDAGSYSDTYGFIALEATGLHNYTSKLHFGGVSDDAGTWAKRMTIDNATGNVGIGTTSPNNLLTLFAATTPSLGFTTNTGLSGWTMGIDTADANKFKIASSTAVGTNPRLTIDGNGNVGIGTTGPSNRLTVNLASSGAYSEPLKLLNSGTGAGTNIGMVFYNGDGVSTGAGAIARIKAIDLGSYDGALAFETANNSNWGETTTEWVRILNNGNVGIGTTNPTQKFQIGNNWSSSVDSGTTVLVNGSGGTQDVAPTSNISATSSTNTSAYVKAIGLNIHNDDITTTGTRVPALTFSRRANATYTDVLGAIDAVDEVAGLDVNWRAGGLAFHTANSGTYGITEKMRITNAGNVGIGTTVPGAVLDVNGNTSITGTLTTTASIGIGTSAPAGAALFVTGRIATAAWTADGDTVAYRDDATNNLAVITSDRRLKKNIVPLTGSLDIISQLNTYKYNDLDEADGSKLKLGLIAQEVLPLIPELTFTFTKEGSDEIYYSVHYDKLSVLLLGAIKEQQAQIDKMKSEIKIASSTLTAKDGTFELSTMNSDLNLNGFSILNVKSIIGMNGLWKIDENGNITAQSVQTQALTVGGGSASGVTVYDRSTTQPKCIYIEGGAIKTSDGACGATQNTSAPAVIVPASASADGSPTSSANATDVGLPMATSTSDIISDAATTTPEIISDTATSSVSEINTATSTPEIIIPPAETATTTP